MKEYNEYTKEENAVINEFITKVMENSCMCQNCDFLHKGHPNPKYSCFCFFASRCLTDNFSYWKEK